MRLYDRTEITLEIFDVMQVGLGTSWYTQVNCISHHDASYMERLLSTEASPVR